jgi:hypothetical protein
MYCVRWQGILGLKCTLEWIASLPSSLRAITKILNQLKGYTSLVIPTYGFLILILLVHNGLTKSPISKMSDSHLSPPTDYIRGCRCSNSLAGVILDLRMRRRSLIANSSTTLMILWR